MSAPAIRIDRAIYTGFISLAAVIAAAIVAFHGALAQLVKCWIAPEQYPHGFHPRAVTTRDSNRSSANSATVEQVPAEAIRAHKSALFPPFERRS
jgi:hypothetical protein